jgi:hypothetical protein
MAPFEAFYGKRCRTLLNWSQVGERTLFGPKLVQEAKEKVGVIRENLRAAQMRQKCYHDKAKAPQEFEVGNYVYLSPTKGVQRFGVKGKLAPAIFSLMKLPINFHKSEIYCFGEAKNFEDQYKELFGCNLGTFPVKYLGIPIHFRKLANSDRLRIEERFENHLSSWKGKTYSY